MITDADWGFTDDIATIKITMDGTTQNLVTVTRKANVRAIKFYQQNAEDASKMDEVSEISLEWADNASSFLTNLYVETNFAWTMEVPAWVANNDAHPLATSGDAGLSAKMWLFADYDNYTVEDMSANIVIKDATEATVTFELPIKATGSSAMMILGKAINSGLEYDQDGKYMSYDLNQNLTLEDSYSLSVKGSSDGFKVLAINYDRGWYGVQNPNTWQMEYDASWVKVSEPTVTGNGGVRDFEYKISVDATSSSRYAALLVIPVSMIPEGFTTTDVLNSDENGFIEKYQPYSVTLISQKVEGLAFQDASQAEAYGATLVCEKDSDYGAFIESEYGCPAKMVYTLTYNSAMSSYGAGISYTMDGTESINYYDMAGNSCDWLYLEPAGNYFQVSMNSEKAANGIIIVKGSDGVALFALICDQAYSRGE